MKCERSEWSTQKKLCVQARSAGKADAEHSTGNSKLPNVCEQALPI